MRILRRRLASSALLVSVLQLALLFAAPVSACCAKAGAGASAAAAASDDAPDCCPPGAHPKGECPLHRGQKKTHCRMTCDRSGPPQLLLGSIGVLPPPASVVMSFAQSRLADPARAALVARPLVPDPPPPRG